MTDLELQKRERERERERKSRKRWKRRCEFAGDDSPGSLAGKLHAEVRSKRTAFMQGLHKIGERVKRGTVARGPAAKSLLAQAATVGARPPRRMICRVLRAKREAA